MDTNQNQNTGFTPLPDENQGAANSKQQTAVVSQAGGIPFAATGKRTIAITREDVEKFSIPEKLITKNPVLVDLILKTESMKDEERKYWFQLLPIMTIEQIEKLQKILQNERDQLAALDNKYDSEVKKLNDKHLLEWKEHEARAEREKRETAERAAEEKENQKQEDVLNQIDSL
jgi:hypothetical protein